MRTDKRLLPLPNAIKPHVIVIAVSIAFTAYLANGGGFSVENLLKTIVARSSGYVAFASAGFGTQNPVIVLLAQCIPATIILLLLSFRRGAYFANFFTVLVVLLLFGLFALSGSRSGVILVTVAVGIFVFSHRNIKLRPLRFFFATALMLIVLSFQTNFRDSGQIRNDFFQHSPFRGFSLNREVAFIVETYPEQLEFYRQGLLHRMVLPIPETIMLFVTNPVPRIFWPNKPVDASFSSFNELRTGATGFAATSNVTPTIPGRFYMLYGWFGVVQIGFVLGLSWRFVDNLLTRARIRGDADMMLVMSTLNAILFISCRDLTPGKFFPVLFLLLFIYVGRLTVRRA